MINVFIACGAGASSTFLAVKLRSLSQSETSQLSFIPSALANVNARAEDIVLVASHIAKDAKVADLSKTGITVIELPEQVNGGFQAETALALVMGHLERHKN
jgi:cellobiose-specific phosphotransferase system component IIB